MGKLINILESIGAFYIVVGILWYFISMPDPSYHNDVSKTEIQQVVFAQAVLWPLTFYEMHVRKNAR